MARVRMPLGTVPPNAVAARQADPTAPKASSKKRKSTEDGMSTSSTAPATKKAKAATEGAVKRAALELVKKAAADLLDVSGVSSGWDDDSEDADGDDDAQMPVYDTCDTVRRKIRAILAKDGITQAAFCRAIATAAYGEGNTKNMAPLMNTFMRQKGPLAGNTSSVFYAAYVFFEKRRVKDGKPKTKDREIMEEIHWNGVDTKVQSGKVSYVVGAGSKVGIDKYGRVITY